MENNILDQWEAEAKDDLNVSGQRAYSKELLRKFLIIIDLVRKKDEALKVVSGIAKYRIETETAKLYDHDIQKFSEEALALTAKVGEAAGRTTKELK